MKNEVAIPFPAVDQPLALRMRARTIPHKQPTHRFVNGISGVIAEVVFALGLCVIGFLISILFVG